MHLKVCRLQSSCHFVLASSCHQQYNFVDGKIFWQALYYGNFLENEWILS